MRPYLGTMGAGAYVADISTGICNGVEGTRNYTLQLVPNALKRLRDIVASEEEYEYCRSWDLWLDDQLDDENCPNRHTPKGFIGAKSSEEAKNLVLQRGLPRHMDLDHDLGGDDNVRIFLKWLSEDYYPAKIPTFEVHSANVMAGPWISSFIKSWRQSQIRLCPVSV